MKAKLFKTVIIIIIFTSLWLTAGCSKITKGNYEKLKVGQDYDEVVEILGKADECAVAMGIKDCRWGDDHRHISVKFVGNKVVIFSARGL